MASLVEHVRKRIDPKTYYEKIFDNARWLSDNELRVKCLFHDDSSPSLYVNGTSGAWFCHGCQAGGKSVVSFHALRIQESHDDAAKELYHTYIRPIIPDKQVRSWVRRLWRTPIALGYLREQRLLSDKVIRDYQLGYDGTRFTIPVRNEFKLCVNAKLYDPTGKAHGQPKMLNYRNKAEERKYGSPAMLFPITQISKTDETQDVMVCEGEWDALALISLGLCAITTTAGCKSWAPEYNELFRSRTVAIAYDNDADGTKYDKIPLRQLQNIAQVIKRVEIPKEVDKKKCKDVTDWLRRKKDARSSKFWRAVVRKAPVLVDNPKGFVEAKELQQVSLSEASNAELFNRRLRIDALVTGKDTAPYFVPRRYRVTCDKSCESCPLAESMHEFVEKTVDPASTRILELIDCPRQGMHKMLMGFAGFDAKPSCRCKVEVLEVLNIEHLLLIPTLDSSTGQYVMRPSYFVGHGLHTNRAYQFQGVTVAHPRDQHTTHLFDAAQPVQDEIETFELTDALKRQLNRFHPKRLTVLAHLMSIAEWQSRNITKIRERPDLHVAVDLAFHSVASFEFNGELVRRGMIDLLVLGDTRCGKGYVTEGLRRYYGLGELASGENCTFAGLVGGVQQAGNKWFITWGLIPLNHGRIAIVDEMSALSETEIGHMSRVRSEGVAEITKIVREQTQANARLIWLSNTRSGRPITSYNTGVEAIKELIGANEDISRFDLALTVANNEVPSEIINSMVDDNHGDSDKYPRELCRALILWAWSRKPAQVKFSQEALVGIIKASIDLGRQYSPAIPLIQAENIRVKLAKISAAVAARVFSTDESCENLLVTLDHVSCARQFLQLCYTKSSMGYDIFSRTAAASQHLDKPIEIDHRLTAMGKDKVAVMAGLSELHRITPDTLADYVGDVSTAKALIGELVQLRCLARIEAGNWYLKNPAFSVWLRENRKKAKLKK